MEELMLQLMALDGKRNKRRDAAIVSNKILITCASDKLIDFMKEHEGFCAKPYPRPNSQNSMIVGYGHVLTTEDGTRYDNGIPEVEATELLKEDLEKVVYQYLNPWLEKHLLILTQNQYDALVDFTFNTGHGWLTEHTNLRDILLSRNVTYSAIYNEFMTRIHVNGTKVLSLYRRRMGELGIFFDNVYKKSYLPMPNNV